MKLKNSLSGFTLVEILVVVTITAIVATVGTISYDGAIKRDQIDSYAKEIVSSLEKARNKAINQEEGDYWGVRFEANSSSAFSNYAIFKGETSGTEFVDIKHLTTSINFTAPNPVGAAPIEEIVFNKSTGTIKDGNNHSIQIGINNSSVSKNIYITKNGLITLELPPGIELLSAPVLSSPIDGLVIGLSTSQTVAWGSVTGAQSYRLEVSNDINFGSLFFYDNTVTTTSYDIVNLQPYTVYYWRVRAYSSSAGNSLWSSTRSFGTLTSPSVPQSPNGVPSGSANTLTWTAPASNGGSAITGYKIYWGTVSGTLSNTISVGNVLTYNHTGLSNGTTYYYKIAAINLIGEGTKTSEFSSTPELISPPTAGSLTITPSTATHVPGTITTMSAPFTSTVTITGCEYTLNGGTNWYASTLSGSIPNYTCTQSNITGFTDGSSYSLNMRATNGAGTTAATATARTGDTIGPTVTDNWTDIWHDASSSSIDVVPSDARSGIFTTKFCNDFTDTCDPSTGTVATHYAIICADTCTYYVRYASWDNVGNASSVYSRTFKIDVEAPTNPVLTATAGDTQISLSWTTATDTGVGLHLTTPYKVVFATGATAPADCSGTALYSGTATTYTHTGRTNGTQYSYRVCAIDNVSNMSSGGTGSAISGNILP
ncbi:MAG: fibronectin type III domain-containing protein, partial [Minisyncoccia bacterium]